MNAAVAHGEHQMWDRAVSLDWAAEFSQHWPAAVRLARNYDRDDPEDLAAAAMLSVVRAVSNGGGPTSGFRAYLLTAVRRTAVSRSRLPGRPVPSVLAEASADDERLSSVWDAAQVRMLLAELPAGHRLLLWQLHVECRPAEAVGRDVGLSASAVGSLAHRIRARIRSRTNALLNQMEVGAAGLVKGDGATE